MSNFDTKYEFSKIDSKWQKIWEEKKAFEATTDYSKPKYFSLVEFPYPSGQGLHIGHPRPYTALDIVSRKKRMQGYNVLFPIGWDAFGLPTENYAIKNHIHPTIVTERNVARFKSQLQALGLSFDWSREINTSSPEYYKWTQWIFLQLYKHGLAYKKEMNVNFCTSCKVVLANEEVVNGVCERCGSEVVHKVKSQWMLKITEYAQRLIDDLADLDFIERVKTQEINWIGRSEGAEVNFKSSEGDDIIVYTTRPDTLFGATYMVISPEHTLIEKWADKLSNLDDIKAYQKEAAKKSDFERTELVKEKTGVRLEGVHAINPVNGKEIPIYISDYVLATYGTGAIMAVPAHDTRDWEFAKKFDLPIIEVVAGGDVQNEAFTDVATGTMVNSGFLDGLEVADAKVKIIQWLEEQKLGHKQINYKLRDWVFSRQRYWGEPVPMVYCEKCGWVPLPEDQLPLMLPDVDAYEPTDTGESPLSKCTDWVNTTCPCCGAPAKRETDTMPNWAGSSWYFMRYCDPKNDEACASKEALDYWMPVDWYNGGMEHVTLHLLYSRFWAKFLYDIGVLSCKEPYLKRTAHGMILGANGEKMSKSRGNVINPDDVIAEYGADTLRLYEMFIGDFEKSAPWSTESIRGCKRFLDRVANLRNLVDMDAKGYSDELESSIHKTIKKVTEDIDSMKFNTAIAAMMSLVNEMYNKGSISSCELKTLITLLNPFAPHLTEEIWSEFNGEGLLSLAKWPEYDEAKTIDNTIEIAIQVNGKLRGTIMIAKDEAKETVIANAKEDEKVKSFTDGKTVVKEIYVPGKLVNIVVR
ncbi:MAG: leucine--tRNA ligase [Ruminococcaceae bacterium]|nr:leucine--tRNA ligase [Oscillospiraceae bacterium]